MGIMAGAPTAAGATCSATAPATEGPYYTPGAPYRASIATPGTQGTPLVLTGRVLTTACAPVARATVDVWQADGTGAYDNADYRLRGKVRTGADGTWRLRTVVPGIYPGRTEHIHVKVGAPGGPVTTTQLYLPGSAGNARDAFFSSSLLIRNLKRSRTPWTGSYTFVVRR